MHTTDVPGRYAGRFSDLWRIGNAVNGGLVMAAAATALRAQIASEGGPHGDPLAFTAYFLTASGGGEVTFDAEVLRAGRSMTTGQVSVSQPGADGAPVERMRALATFGDLAASAQVVRQPEPPQMPGPDECISSRERPPMGLTSSSFLDRLDLRLDPATSDWAAGRPSGRGEIQGWVRLADGREPDPIALLLALDAFPPVAFDLGIPGWAPTLELSAHIRARPASGWLRMRASTATLAGGLLEEDAVVWDSTGRMVAQSRQLCGVRMPEGFVLPGRPG
ncbi:MAG: thioesterase family protein [Lapillicoccus sp.]